MSHLEQDSTDIGWVRIKMGRIHHFLSQSRRLIHTPPFLNLITLWPNGHDPSQVPSAFLIIAGGGVLWIQLICCICSVAHRDLSAPTQSHLINILGDESVAALINNSWAWLIAILTFYSQ